jgi:uncharacterized damage-inducible protein DinB
VQKRPAYEQQARITLLNGLHFIMLPYLQRLFTYDDWANREVLRSLRAANVQPQRSLKLLAHIIAAEWLWLNRIRQQSQGLAIWPDLTLAESEAHLADLNAAWTEYLAGLGGEQLALGIAYTNSKGERWTSSTQDVLFHIVMHSAYHRGQIAADMRANGQTPAYTDFIHAVRQGLVK